MLKRTLHYLSVLFLLSVISSLTQIACGGGDDGMPDECMRIVYENSPEVMEFHQAFPESMLETGAINDIALTQYPNPDDASTIIEYTLPQDSKVNLAIYTRSGMLLKTLLVNTTKPAGYHGVIWDGTNALGKPVSEEVYVVLETPEKRIQLNI